MRSVVPRWVLLALSASWGCEQGAASSSPCLRGGGDTLPLAWPGGAAIVVQQEAEQVRARGFSGAAAPLAEVVARAGDLTVRVAADAQGRFELWLPGRHETLELSSPPDAVPLRFRTREFDDAVACVVGEPVPVGTTPNDVEFANCGAGPKAMAVSSGDGTLEFPAQEADVGARSVAFPLDDRERGPVPWSVASKPDSALVAVSLFGQDKVALLDACEAAPLGAYEPRAADGGPWVVPVQPALQPSMPIDADDDGVVDPLITQMTLRAPEGVAFSADRLFVTYTNLIDTGPPALLGPGVLVSFLVVEDELLLEGVVVLPLQNPQAVITDELGAAWVSCSGALERRASGFSSASRGGLVRVSPDTLSVTQVIDLGDFAPGTPALIGEYLVVGSLLSAQVLRLPRDAVDASRAAAFSLGAEGLESIFEVRGLMGGLALVTEFGADALHVLDVAAGQLHPWPFLAPLTLRQGSDISRGLQAIAVHAPSSPGVPVAAALLGLSSEWVPLRFDEVFGP